MKKFVLLSLLSLGLVCTGSAASATPLSASVILANTAGQKVGSARLVQSGQGLQITLDVQGLSPGEHGMHIHEMGSCTPGKDAATGQVVAFGGAGGHFDPGQSKNHARPTTDNRYGHGGDLPMLTVGANGTAHMTFITNKLSLLGVNGVLRRSLVIHASPDDYHSDPAGMSGAREWCGVITRDGLRTRDYTLPGPQDFPEGVAYSAKKSVLYTGSAKTGDIYVIDADSGQVRLFAKGGAVGRTSALGLKVASNGQLWIAGGTTGIVSILSPDGAPVTQIKTPADPNAYLNDLTLMPDGTAYVTDSGRPVLWRIGTDYRAQAWLDLSKTPIGHKPGLNLNGIVATPDSRYLLAVQTNTGDLWRIDIRHKAVKRIMTGLSEGDGLLLNGHTLYVVRNAEELITRVQLSAGYSSGKVITQEPLTGLRFPTTLTQVGSNLIVAQGQLNKLQGGVPEAPFKLTRFNKF